MNHVVLLGDSILDNAAYVPGRPAVIEQLRAWLPDWQATLLAVDGAVVRNVAGQVVRLPAEASHLIVSVGGNDALENAGILAAQEWSAPQGFAAFAEIQYRFRQDYRKMLDAVLSARRPTVLCTIYDSVPGLEQEAVMALSVFNDVILRAAFHHGLPVLDLRLICDEARDYSSLSPIEPSEIGGAKIVQGIKRVLTEHDFARGLSVVYGK